MREEFKDLFAEQLSPRQLNSTGSYLPVKGIYSIGWRGWRDLPEADFVASLTEWHDGFIREHKGEAFFPLFGQLVQKGELSPEELKQYFEFFASNANLGFYYEGLAHYRAHLAGLRDIRDLLAWHLFEESGHNEMLADFMEGYLKMNRVREVYPLMDPLLIKDKNPSSYKRLQRIKLLNAQGHFVELAAASILRERILPKAHRLINNGLRKEYEVPDKYMQFFDVHCFIDIYHPRFAQYILGKYATTKELKQQAENAFRNAVLGEYENSKKNYERLQVSRR